MERVGDEGETPDDGTDAEFEKEECRVDCASKERLRSTSECAHALRARGVDSLASNSLSLNARFWVDMATMFRATILRADEAIA